uniref:Amyloid beta protein binding family A member 1 n=1 Tax=Tetraodon nigroviridis TaxID=99883 RepID=H3CDA8_TETNG
MNPLHTDQDPEATDEADAPPGQRNNPQGRSRNHNHQEKRYRRCEAPPGNSGGRARRRPQEEPGAELHPVAQHQPAQPIPRPAVARYRRQGDSEARIRAQQQRHRQRQQREAERAQQMAQQQDKRHHREMNQEDERERDDSALARSASTESGFHTHTDRAEGDDGLLMMSLEPEAQPDVEDEVGNYGVQLRPEVEGYTEDAEAEQHPHPNYPPQPPPPPPPPLPRDALPDLQNPEDTRNAAYSNYVYAQPPSHGGPPDLLDTGPTEEAYSEPYDIYSLSEHVYEEIGEVPTSSEEVESLQQRRAGFQLLEGRMGEADYHQQESVGSRLRHYDERSDGESDSPEKEAEFAPYPRADSCDQEEDVGSSAAEGKDSLVSGDETIQEGHELKQEGGTPEGQPQTGSDKNQPVDDRGDATGEQQAENSAKESVALRHNQQKRDAISLAIKDIKEAIEEVKNRTVRSPYTPDEPKEPIWVMRQDLSPTVECDLQPQGGDVSTTVHNNLWQSKLPLRLGLEPCLKDLSPSLFCQSRRSLASFPTYVEVPGPCDPEDLIDGIIFAANYLGSTQLLSDKTPSKNIRMMQAQEAVSRIKTAQKLAQTKKVQYHRLLLPLCLACLCLHATVTRLSSSLPRSDDLLAFS